MSGQATLQPRRPKRKVTTLKKATTAVEGEVGEEEEEEDVAEDTGLVGEATKTLAMRLSK